MGESHGLGMIFSSQKRWSNLAGQSLWRIGLVLALCFGLLGACGKRPSQVDPPPGGQTQPRVYPDPATDPRP